MANLINKITEQIVEGVDAAHFLANIENAAHWVEHVVGEAVDAVEELFTPELAVTTVGYTDGSSATGVTPLPLQSPAEQDAATTVEVPAEAAAIAAAPEQAQ